MVGWLLPNRIIPYIISASMHGVSRLGITTIDHVLCIGRMVERQENHTFTYQWAREPLRYKVLLFCSSFKTALLRQNLTRNPILCKESDLWYAMVPLINFEVVEWHYPSWVMRQFEPHQYVPQSCNTCVALHDIDLHGPFAGIDWKWDTPPEFQCGMSDDKEWWRGHQSMDQCHTTPYMV